MSSYYRSHFSASSHICNISLDDIYSDFFLAGCWVYVFYKYKYKYKCSSALLSHAVELLENNLILLCLAFDLLGGSGTVLGLGLILPHSWGRNALSTQPNAPWIMRLSRPAGGKSHFSWPSVSICNVSFNLFAWFFPDLGQFPHTHALVLLNLLHWYLLNTPGHP